MQMLLFHRIFTVKHSQITQELVEASSLSSNLYRLRFLRATIYIHVYGSHVYEHIGMSADTLILTSSGE